MSGILVIAEHEGGSFKKTAAELLGKATELAAALGTTVSAAVLGDAPATELGAFGASKVYQVPGDFSSYDTDRVVAGLQAALEAASPDAVLASASFLGKDAMPRLVARLGGGQASECTELRVDGGTLVGRRPLYAGKAFADARITRSPAVFTVRPNSFGQPEAGSGGAEVVEVSAELPEPRITLVEQKTPERDDVDLSEAERIVSGGRSLKSEDNFDSVVRPLAKSLGATAGASRAAVDAGYAPHGDQVGQTGKTVNPQLYIALGISGAIQHLAGMRTSKVIVAVNTDPDAPIFEHATYGLVADLFEVAPKLQAAFESLD
ncbi:MAG: electron transfer flavoprotein subunit alpha/FixB family protein [Deltaproteobacteria bacterium]|nr:MAG: electron transfer flavoprotein subunit alpha/FixB family protein [Deltaproteobacteria bacterium]